MREQDAATPCSVGREYLLFLAGLGLRQSAASYALGDFTVTIINENFGCLGRYGLAGLLGVSCCH